MHKFQREERYTVLKVSDIQDYLSVAEVEELIQLEQKINHSRKIAGKEPLQCVVVEHDWPEFEPTWQAIEDRVTQR